MKRESLFVDLDHKFDEVFSIMNGKKVIIWGYGCSGMFLEHLFRRRNRQIELFIDDYKSFPSTLNIFQSTILAEMDVKDSFIICSFGYDEEADGVLQRFGYEKGVSYVYLPELIYGAGTKRKLSYFDWLEEKYGIDLVDPKYIGVGDDLFYSYGSDYALLDVLDNFCFREDDNVFDFGCGKGGPLIMFYERGIGRVGGVELDVELFETAKENMKKCGIVENDLYNCNATDLKEELDDYGYFYMYNPFKGDTFKRVICNIEESFRRKKRRIIFMYSGVTQHKAVIANGYFRLVMRIRNEYWNKYTNIYVID